MPESYHQLNICYSQVIVPKSLESPLHVHDDFEIFFLLSGSGSYVIEKSVYNLKPGDLVIINNSENHQGLMSAERISEGIEIHFNPDLLSPFSQTFNLFHCFLNRRKGAQNKLLLNKPQREKTLKLFKRIPRSF